jgi:cystathionine gamma-synthase
MRCKDFIHRENPTVDQCQIRIINLVPQPELAALKPIDEILPHISAVLFPAELWPSAKAFWQHTGEGVQSRRAEFCQRAFDDKFLVDQSTIAPLAPKLAKGPRRYQRTLSVDFNGTNGCNGHATEQQAQVNGNGVQDLAQFVEERFGRNLNTRFAAQAKLAVRRRIAGSLTENSELPESLNAPVDIERQRNVPEFSIDDVYLYPCGMNAIFNAHRILMAARGPLKSVMYGFPYVDSLKVLEKFGPGALFYGHGDSNDLDDLERRLKAGERFLLLFCEFPGNPLLKSPDLQRIRTLADTYDFAVVIDETIGNFLNVNVLPYADIVVSSLTKIFSGDSNVMGGTLILNPRAPAASYAALKRVLATEYEDNQFEEDAVYLERNSRDFVARIARANANALAIVDVLRAACPSKVKQVYYPRDSPTRAFYDHCRLPNGGYGGLASATFHSVEDAALFYDHLETNKGPSLGTNFTLASPFVLLAHYGELEWAAQYGCEQALVRFSVGLEDSETLVKLFQEALAAVPER